MICRFWKNPIWRHRIVSAVTLLLVLSLALHPELRLLVPFLDSLGVDVLLSLVGAQAASFLAATLKPHWVRLVPHLRPVLAGLARLPAARTAVRWFDAALIKGGGSLGLYVWAQIRYRFASGLGPNNSSKPTPLRGAA